MPTPPTAGPGGFNPEQMKQSIDQLNSMDDTQMDYMINMMKSNPAMMKANYEA